MLKKSLATLGLLALLNIPLFSQENSKTDSLLIDFFLDKKVEKSVLVTKDSLIDVTLYSSIGKYKVDTIVRNEVLEKYDTLTHAHNHIEDIHIHARWGNQRKIKKAFRKFDEKTLENRLMIKINSSVDLDHLLF